MDKIDLKDRKILYQLDLNCRQSNSQIGKKVGLGRNVVAYRINKMQDEGIIDYFWTVIDTFKLGYNVFRLYLKIQDISKEKKQSLIEELKEYKNMWSLSSSAGSHDIGCVIWINDCYDFYHFLERIFNKYGKYISKKTISVYIQADEYEKTYLLSNKIKNIKRKKFSINCKSKKIKIDKLDYEILEILSLNARIPLIDIAKKLDTSSQTVNYRIDNLQKLGIIKGFRVEIDITKLGLQYFDIRVDLQDYSFRKKIIDYLTSNPYFKCLNTAVGYKDLEVEFVTKNLDDIMTIMDDLNDEFPNVIRDYHFFKYRVTHKECWLPKMEF